MNNELDDLFRQQLDGHATPPPADLWARLQARTAAEADAADPLDAQFRAGLAGHATPPRRELWERLEDEHLRPRQRRRPVVAWGRLAIAASLLLFVLAGGAGLWWSARPSARGPVAVALGGSHQLAGPRAAATSENGTTNDPSSAATIDNQVAGSKSALTSAAPVNASRALTAQAAATASATQLATGRRQAATALLATEIERHQKNRKIFARQATGLGGSSSSSPVASTGAQRRPATAPGTVPGHLPTTPQPDATADTQLALGGRKTSTSQLATQSETPVLAAAAPQVIEVEVRRGSRPALTETPVVAAATLAATEAAAEPRPHLRLGGLLRQAGHALRGEQVSLAEATGLPETVTVQAHLGDRVLSRTIRL